MSVDLDLEDRVAAAMWESQRYRYPNPTWIGHKSWRETVDAPWVSVPESVERTREEARAAIAAVRRYDAEQREQLLANPDNCVCSYCDGTGIWEG